VNILSKVKKMLRATKKNAKTITKCYGPICEQDPQAKTLAHAELIETHWV
jgi:hypothetical protein